MSEESLKPDNHSPAAAAAGDFYSLQKGKNAQMKTLLVMDEHNYDPTLEEIRRVAVRGIIFIDGRLLLIRSCFGELKLPGGGQEAGESDLDTLVRETLEETGYRVIPESVQEFGEVEEKRMSVRENMIWHQFNRYYFCRVLSAQEDCSYSESEKEYGFRQVLHTLDEAIGINEEMLAAEGRQAWNQREYKVLLLIKEHLAQDAYH